MNRRYSLVGINMEKWVVKFNEQPTNCSACNAHLFEGDGVILQVCTHPFCRVCLREAVESCSQEIVRCPLIVNDPPCEGILLPGEIKGVSFRPTMKKSLEGLRTGCERKGLSGDSNKNTQNGALGSVVSIKESSAMYPTSSPKPRPRLGNGLAEPVFNIMFNLDPTSCGFCSSWVPAGSGIMLQECLHVFCKDCLRGAIASHRGGPVPCPNCQEHLLEREIRAILPKQAYEEHSRKELEDSIIDLPLFRCKTNGCPGVCLIEADSRRIFLCEFCNRQNCLNCQAIHDSIPCEEWIRLRREADLSGERVSDEELLERGEDFGCKQLSKTVKALLQEFPDENLAGFYEAASYVLETIPVVQTTDDFECAVCTRMASEVPDGGIMLQQCTHSFCRECLENIVKRAEELPIPCPFVHPITGLRCAEFLSAAEFKALAPPEVFDKHVRWGWRIAEDIIQKKFHCLQPNCEGFWEISDDQSGGSYTCPLCSSTNCVNCNVIHTGQTCFDYQETLRLEAERLKDDENRKVQAQNERVSEAEVNKLINQRQFMRCPFCGFVCEKISGCAHVQCLNRGCRRDFNWYQ